jgi:hypothetical protein
MKDMHESWQQEESLFELDEAFLDKALKKDSCDPLIRLRKNLGIKLIWIAGFSLLFLLLIITTDKLYNRILISPLLLAYAVGLTLIYGQYRMLGFVDKSQNMRYILKAYYYRITRIQQYELKVAVFLYPISITAGFVYGFSLKRSADEILTDIKILTILIMTNLILIPLCYYLARWMDRKAYGRYLDQLKEDIDQLETA